ncbi:distal tail protein Dit [Metabacillus bambusae]|uniref:Phage tail family protein n=1 Tax=Metabacillus bambusae TaxID=2795218 RepID=A0ABS3NA08_9BACI|nr:distal tail protein Dit [Metabacillus bambusae]MBO1515058.1 phage tail family protein [Metabacillus bambusae]
MFYFKGKWSNEYPIIVNRIIRGILSPISRDFLEIPARPGAFLQNTKRGLNAFKVEITIHHEDVEEYNTLIRDLAGWLFSKKAEEFIIAKDPSIKYYAVLEGSTDLNEIVTLGEGVLTFVCPNPDGQGPLKGITINDTSDPSIDGIIANNGTAETFPKFIAEITQLTTSLSIVSSEYHVTLGSPDNVDSTPVPPRERVFNETMSSTTGWTNGSSVDEGTVGGTFTTDGQNFIPNGFGTGNSWHGPAAKKSLTTPVQDFMVEAVMDNDNSPVASLGRVELYLLDENSQVIGVMGVKDSWKNEKTNTVYFRAGSLNNGTYILNGYGSKKTNYNDFYGYLRIERVGTLWTVYVARIDANGNHFVEWSKSFRDSKNFYTARLAQIQVHFGQYQTYTPTTLRVRDINGYKINDLSSTQIPYIGQPGDIFEIDHIVKKVRKNGELFSDIDLSSRFFALKNGNNALEVYPKNVAIVSAEYRERYL